MDAQSADTSKTYQLSLSAGHGWHLMATGSKNALVDKVASIMRLGNGAGHDCPRLILAGAGGKTTEGPVRQLANGLNEGMPREGWREVICGPMRIWHHREVEDVIYENAVDAGSPDELNFICSYLFPVYRKVIASGGMPVHAALVELHGKGVMLAAPGDTGKSTCCRRLPPPWEVLGDEETVVIKDHVGRYFAHPFPTWSDIYERELKKSWDVGKSVALNAIFFLEQSGITEVLPIGRGQAAMQLNHLAREKLTRGWWCDNAEDIERLTRNLFDNACDLVREVPSFTLRTSLTGRFWEKIEGVLG